MNIGIVIGLIKALAPGVDPAVIEQAVTDWLDDHPEATTTVQDGSITEEKLAQDVLADLAEIEGLKEAIENVDEELYKDVYGFAQLTITSGKYYKLTGEESTYGSAKHSQAIPVVAGTKVYVSAKSQAAIAGIIFYNSGTPSSSSFVSYDCYTGNTVTFTNEEVTVPSGATYAVVQSTSDVLSLKLLVKASRMDMNEDDIESIQTNDSFMENTYCNRMMTLARTAGFVWSTFPGLLLTIRVDDLREDVDNVAKIVTGEYGFPLVVAACVKELNKTVSITDPEEKIGDTRVEVCQWVQEHGGEIVVHPDATVTSGDYATVKQVFIDSKRTLEENGIIIRGTACANAEPSESLAKKLDPYLYGYYDYSDYYGTRPPYNINNANTVLSKSLHDFNDATAFESWLDARVGYRNWYTLIFHQISDGGDVTEQTLRGILDVIAENVTQGNVAVMTYGSVYDTYGTHS